ncbi:hypothetical protein [Vibrio furnissii]|uniref:hypothetical protein n=1 Tax=Vibrio furnissii TaxID=29494 RepID=UPI0012EC51AD|nr:hypothetical protein [Vibrio furnissii]MCG6268617.1 hypothetical protein [Vibrio furnissii]MVC39938.1 hypothetical protein [Vibrio cholerae]HCE4999449.1 hypothetical protein [Vibrio parahaemolyticus]
MIRSNTIRDNKSLSLQKKLEAKRKKASKPDLIHVIWFSVMVLVGWIGSYLCLMDIIKTFSVLSMIVLPLCLILGALFTKPTLDLTKEYFE